MNVTLAYDYVSMVTDNTPNDTEICLGTVTIEKNFVSIAVFPAIVIVLLMSFLQERKTLCLGCCYRRPAIAYPLNFIDEHERRWAFAAAFGIITYKVLLLFDGEYYYSPAQFDDPVWMAKYGFVKVFVQIINVIQVGLVFYPMFACITFRRNIAANILGFLYTASWLAISLLSILMCMDQNVKVDVYTFEAQTLLDIIFYIPVFICYVILLVAFIMDFVINIRTIIRHKDTNKAVFNDVTDKDTTPKFYVRHLFLRENRRVPQNLVKKLKHKVKYQNTPGLKYSTRVTCTMVVAAFALLKSGIELGFWLDITAQYLVALLDVYGKDLIGLVNNNSTDLLYDRIVEGVMLSRVFLVVCNGVSLAVQLIFMVLMVLSYRQHIKKYILGHRKWHYPANQSPGSALIGSMRYSGNQIAFIIYGWIALFLVLFLLIMILTVLVALPLRDGYSTFIIVKLKELWPALLVSVAVMLIQRALAKFVFLQERGKYMALNNRNWYHVLSYFLFFFNVLLGLFTAIKRILVSMVAGILLLGRLDHVLMMRGFERFDAGFNAYLGMLHTEVYHTHPILLYFVECLEDSASARRQDFTAATNAEELELQILKRELQRLKRKRQVLANKWHKAITLINNPSLLVERIQKLMTDVKEGDKAERYTQLEQALKQAHHVIVRPTVTVTASNSCYQLNGSIPPKNGNINGHSNYVDDLSSNLGNTVVDADLVIVNGELDDGASKAESETSYHSNSDSDIKDALNHHSNSDSDIKDALNHHGDSDPDINGTIDHRGDDLDHHGDDLDHHGDDLDHHGDDYEEEDVPIETEVQPEEVEFRICNEIQDRTKL